MAYSIRKTNGNLLLTLETGVKDTSVTNLTLVGKNVSEFGQAQNENFVTLLENSANDFAPLPGLTGQLWFDTINQQMQVKTSSGFKKLGPFPAPTTPAITDDSDTLATTAFVHNVIPKGVILMWSGEIVAIPPGWALCDGGTYNSINSPDLTSRFVMGSGVTKIPMRSATTYAPGDVGGQSFISDVPRHSHTFSSTSGLNNVDHTHAGVTTSANPHYHIMPGDDQLGNASGRAGWSGTSAGGWPYDATSKLSGGGQMWHTSEGGAHSHPFNTGFQSSNHTHDVSGTTSVVGPASVNILPPYYSLAYIIKII